MLVAEPLCLGRSESVQVLIGGQRLFFLVFEGLIGWQFGNYLRLVVVVLVAAARRERGSVFGHCVDSGDGSVSLLWRSASHQI